MKWNNPLRGESAVSTGNFLHETDVCSKFIFWITDVINDWFKIRTKLVRNLGYTMLTYCSVMNTLSLKLITLRTAINCNNQKQYFPRYRADNYK